MTLTIPVQAPNGWDEILAHFGDPKIAIVNGEWTVDRKWEDGNLITIKHPIIPAAQLGKLYVHRYIAEPALRTFERWRQRQLAGDPYQIVKLGCFCPRAKAGRAGANGQPSTHCLAIAIDANPDTNRLIDHIALDDPRRKTEKDLPDAWLADWKAEGFILGAEFSTRFDPMHGQLCSGY